MVLLYARIYEWESLQQVYPQKRLNKMKMLETSLLTGIYTILKMSISFISNKIIAIYVGPAGIAILGNIQNYITLVYLISGDVLKSAITKYTAEDKTKSREYIKSAIYISFMLNTIIINFIIFFSNEISEFLTKSTEFSLYLAASSITIPLAIIPVIILSYLNGIQKINLFIKYNFISSLLGLFSTIFLTINYGLIGAIISVLTNQSLILFYILIENRKHLYSVLSILKTKTSIKTYKKLFTFSFITFIAIICSTSCIFFIRELTIYYTSINIAGEWQSAWTICQLILTLLTISLNTYFLPKISSLKIRDDLNKEIYKGIKIFIPLTLIACFFLYILRENIIILLYTKEFLPAKELFPFLLVGIFFKSVSWFYGISFVAKAKVKITVFSEIFISILWCLTSWFLIAKYSVVGLTYSYAITSFIHMLIMYLLYIRENRLCIL
ncbi:O-antigen translocase [Providencia alcalifaciens]|uniref:Polysaccharide biosynthesis protein n=2 Tax=Providencia alcalifaciens TaxID=126385 RepID=B6XJS5_9GAMM|nr:O-antigen translocase [Providencia alcalifaciens]EEB44282.1 polysaccharide biosynthesis protein [Providencia alcalifaciens DSM 30120]